MKKLFILIVALCASIPIWAYDFTSDGVAYNITDAQSLTVEVASKNSIMYNYTGDIIIPLTVTYGGKIYRVTAIGENAFMNSKITSISIANSVTKISNNSFYNCIELKSIIMSDSVKTIGDLAFRHCATLPSITIPKSVTSIGEYAFYENDSLKAVYITDLAAWCKINFYHQYSNPIYKANHLYLNGQEVIDITIPDGVDSISNYTFISCKGLKSVKFPNSVISIGECAFGNCLSLKSVSLPEHISSLEASAFNSCGIDSISIPSSIKIIGERAFASCTKITSVFISDLTAWCNIDFKDCDSNPFCCAGNNHLYLSGQEITELTIPNTIRKVKKYAFYGCKGIKSLTISDSISSIGEMAFYCCYGLDTVNILNGLDTIGKGAFYICKNLQFISIPNSVEVIGDNAFWSCNSLTTITIPNSVKTIGGSAFWQCTGLTSIVSESTIPPTCVGGSFSGVDYSIPVYVPEGSVEDYQAAVEWENFTNYQTPQPTSLEQIGEYNGSKDLKVIENGRLYIIHDGIKYNVSGITTL